MCVSVADSKTLLVRQYHIRLKKTGTKVMLVSLYCNCRLSLSCTTKDRATVIYKSLGWHVVNWEWSGCEPVVVDACLAPAPI